MYDAAWTKEHSPFHAAERAIQERLGVRDKLERQGRRMVRDYLPDQHRELMAQLPMIVIGSVDDEDRPWASLLTGAPGFLSSDNIHHLRINAAPSESDPAAAGMRPGSPVGLLAIQLESRRRNRLNATVTAATHSAIDLSVDQTFGNCPQYIQARSPQWANRGPQELPLIEAGLSDTMRQHISQADTFFVASFTEHGSEGTREVDVSHRGGPPGFVKVDGDTLTIPDYAGNFHFNTLGNLEANPKAGLIFPDFETGDVLQVTGSTEIIWDGPEVDATPGAKRLWRVHVTEAVVRPASLPFNWSAPAFSKGALKWAD